MSGSAVGDWLATNGLALYAAVLSTALAITTYAYRRPRMMVSLCPGMDESGATFAIDIVNPSAHPLHVKAVSLLYRYREPKPLEFVAALMRLRGSLWLIGWASDHTPIAGLPTAPPFSIPPHTCHTIHVPRERVLKMLQGAIGSKIAASVQDGLRRNRYSETLETAGAP